MQLGPYRIDPPLVLAPMAGVTDKPFRMLCKRLGAGLCVSEMTTSDPRFWKTSKSLHRMDHEGEPAPDPDVAGPWYSLEHTFVLEAGESWLPTPPVSGKAETRVAVRAEAV